MFTQACALLLVSGAIGQELVPFAARGSYCSDAVSDRIDALEENLLKLEKELSDARRENRDTSGIESQLETLRQALGALEPPPNERLSPYIPALLEWIDHQAGFVAALPSASQISTEQADQLIDFLYRELGHPSANYRLQLIGVQDIRRILANPELPGDTKERFRARLESFYQAGGGACAPEVMAGLGESLFLSSSPGDTSFQTAKYLMENAELWFGAVGQFREQRQCRESRQTLEAQRQTELRIQSLVSSEDIAASSVAALSSEIINEFSSSRRRGSALAVLLREYRRLLKRPDLDIEIAQTIEANLISIAQLPRLKDKHDWEHWKLWADAGRLLSNRGAAMKDFAVRELERLSASSATRKTAHTRAIRMVNRACSR